MIFVDSNIPMYLIGAAHPHKAEAQVAQNRALLSARDAVHIAVMERHSVRSILSFDDDFDRWPGLQRIHQI